MALRYFRSSCNVRIIVVWDDYIKWVLIYNFDDEKVLSYSNLVFSKSNSEIRTSHLFLPKKLSTPSQYKLNHYTYYCSGIPTIPTICLLRSGRRVTGTVGQDNSISVPVSLVGAVEHTLHDTLPTHNTIKIGWSRY